MRIEFGGGENPRKPEYTQVDIRKLDNQTIVCPAWEIDEHVEENSVTDIFSRHFFEHVSRANVKKLLEAWHKICLPKARIELICPNMKLHMWQWQNWGNLTAYEKEWCLAGFFGWQRDEDGGTDWDFHKNMYDIERITELLERYGFHDINQIAPDWSPKLDKVLRMPSKTKNEKKARLKIQSDISHLHITFSPNKG